ncbi:hypothetical protein IWZ01DRAFT_559744 [Phyllosticta capitalensis]
MASKDGWLSGLAHYAKAGFQEVEGTDLMICSQGERFFVHRLIVCTQSDFFRNACGPNSPFQEARTGVVHLDDDHPFLVQLMLSYCYTGRVDEDMLEDREAPPCNQFGVEEAEIYAIADKYQIHGLECAAIERFRDYLEENTPDNLDECWWHQHVSVIAKKVYETTPSTNRGLRDIVLSYTWAFFDHLVQSKVFKANTDKIEDFWAEFAQFHADRKARLRRCPDCGIRSMQSFQSWTTHLKDSVPKAKCAICPHCRGTSSFKAWNRPLDAGKAGE